jgi:hypothetical protein
MKFTWKKYSEHDDQPEDIDLYLTLDDGRCGLVAFVRPVYAERLNFAPEYRDKWLARSMLGDFVDENKPLKSKRAAMLKCRREFPVLWIGADPEKRDELF